MLKLCHDFHRPPTLALLVVALSAAALIAGCGHRSSSSFIASGDQARHNGQLGQAEKDYQDAINANPHNPHAHVALGQLYVSEKKPDLARSEFMKALEIAPMNAPAHAALGSAYADAAQFSQAEEQYRAAAALAPGNADYRLELGSVLIRAQKPGAAEAELRTAIGLEPKNAHAHLALANLLGSEPGRQDEAQAETAEVRSLDPSLLSPANPAAAATVVPAAAPTERPSTPPPRLRTLDKRYLLTHDSPVYSAPNNTTQIVAQVHRRRFVHVTGMVGDWFRVQLRNGTVGYIPVATAE
jgi:tetratricopeptide (TPR) repeat protein